MVKKLNIKLLALIFGVLLVILVVTQIREKKQGSRSFKNELVTIDSAKVTAIMIYPRHNQNKPYRLVCTNSKWTLLFEGKTFNADENIAGNLLMILKNLKTKLIASKDPAKWAEYQVLDTACTHVQVEQGNDKVVDMFIGKFAYQKVGEAQLNSNSLQSQNADITSFVRFLGDPTIYGVDGMISMLFNRDLVAFRNKNIINSDKRDWEKLSFVYADSSFVLEKKNKAWWIEGLKVDSVAVEAYLRNVAYLTCSQFDDSNPQLTSPLARLRIEGKNMSPIEVNAFAADASKRYYLKTSLNQGTIFSDPSNNLVKTIFFRKAMFFAK